MKTREGDHVDCQFAKIGIQLTRETQAGGDTRHGQGNQMVEISIGGSGELEGAEANVIESFIVNTERLVGVLHQLVNRESSIVRLDDGVRHFG